MQRMEKIWWDSAHTACLRGRALQQISWDKFRDVLFVQFFFRNHLQADEEEVPILAANWRHFYGKVPFNFGSTLRHKGVNAAPLCWVQREGNSNLCARTLCQHLCTLLETLTLKSCCERAVGGCPCSQHNLSTLMVSTLRQLGAAWKLHHGFCRG